ncbi:hypothetical protein D9M68_526500 [compost metagenome]
MQQHAALGRTQVRLQGRLTARVMQVDRYVPAIRQLQLIALQLYAAQQQATVLQPGQGLRIQARRQPGIEQGLHAARLAPVIQRTANRQLLHTQFGVHRAAQHPGLGQHQQAADEHLAAAIQAFGKGLQAANPGNLGRPLRGALQRLQQRAVTHVIVLPGEQRSGQRITHRTDADLQGTAIAYQGAGMQADAMILHRHRHVRRGKQRAAVLLQQLHIKGCPRDFRRAAHIGQCGMHLGQAEDGFTSGAALLQ